MRLKLVVPLLLVALCGQGCLSFFFYRPSSDPLAQRYRSVSLTTGIVSGALLTAGTTCLAVGAYGMQNDPGPEAFNLGGFALAFIGGLLEVPGIITGIISMIYGGKHYREAQRAMPLGVCADEERFRRRPGAAGGRTVDGLPERLAEAEAFPDGDDPLAWIRLPILERNSVRLE
ncbi:MAG: hypothetical protein ACYS47_09305 [Planctomycetota bacterium]|jgi:hypothetical protein